MKNKVIFNGTLCDLQELRNRFDFIPHRTFYNAISQGIDTDARMYVFLRSLRVPLVGGHYGVDFNRQVA